MNIFKTYYLLTKPGIIMGNLIVTIGAFALASQADMNIVAFVSLLFGTSLIIASACVFNNYLDRDIDAKMRRTKARAFVTGTISIANGLFFASILGIIGFILLYFLVNPLTAIIGLTGFVVYVLIYTFSKRKTEHGTLLGSVSGAIPPVAGYTGATNRLDIAALLLFLILVFWQMPHFYAIAMYRVKDYAAASIPVLPLKRGPRLTKIQMALYIFLFIIVSSLLSLLGFTGYTYFFATLILGIIWLTIAIQGFQASDDALWARKMFKVSIAVLMTLCILWALEVVLP